MKEHEQMRFRRSGFTLIEVLVAVTILAIIFTIVFGTFFYTVNNAEEQEERAALYHRASYILNDISQTVSSAFVPFGGEYPPDEEDEKPVFLGEMNPVVEQEISSLSVFTTNRFYSARGDIQDIAYVSYEVAESGDIDYIGWVEDENNPLVLKCKVETLFLNPESEDEEKPLWALNISSLDIEYFDGSDWLSTWDYEEKKALPVAVKVNLELADSNALPHSFSTIAFVHVNTLLEEVPEDVGTELIENNQQET